MTKINSYLTFSGNCREAMTFYKECLGGELTLQAIGESPMADKHARRNEGKHLAFYIDKSPLTIMGSDMVGEKGLIKGNSVSLMLNCSSEKETRNYYEKLSEGGEATHPLEKTFWGALFGDLVDKYGHHWLLHYQTNSNKQNK